MSEERRKKRRDIITVPVNYSYSVQPGGGGPKKQSTSGISLNVSDAGMCFYTHMPLQEGARISVSSKAIWEASKKGVVKWCRKITEELYRVGVELEA